MSTLRNILKKKKAGEIKTLTKQVYWSDYLQEEIVLKKRTASLFFDILAKHDIVNEDGSFSNSPMPFLNELIFTHAEMFEDKKALKEAMDYHGVAEPLGLPEAVFDSHISEMTNVAELISNFYDTEQMGEDIKN